MLNELKPTFLYHQGAPGGIHERLHGVAKTMKEDLDFLGTLPRVSIVIMATGKGVILYDQVLHGVLESNKELPESEQALHPEEEAELNRLHAIFAETAKMARSPMN